MTRVLLFVFLITRAQWQVFVHSKYNIMSNVFQSLCFSLCVLFFATTQIMTTQLQRQHRQTQTDKDRRTLFVVLMTIMFVGYFSFRWLFFFPLVKFLTRWLIYSFSLVGMLFSLELSIFVGLYFFRWSVFVIVEAEYFRWFIFLFVNRYLLSLEPRIFVGLYFFRW